MAINVDLYQGSKTYNSISVYATFSSGGTQAAYYRFFKNGVGDSPITSMTPTTSTTKYWTYSSLNGSTSYSLTVHYYDANKSSLGSDSLNVTTAAPPDTTPPSINSWYSTQIGTNSVTMYVSASDNKGVNGFWFYLNGASYSSRSGSSSTTITFTGLQPDTSYSFGVKAYDAAQNASGMTTRTVRTEKARPKNFEWDQGKYSGNRFNLTASEWRRLCASINEFREYKGKGSYSFTYVTSGTKLTANIYNQVATAIRDMSPPTSASTVNSGTKVLASHFTTLRNSLNSIP